MQILNDLHFVMLQGNLKARKDTMWTLSNLACDKYAADFIVHSPTCIINNVLFEVKKNDLDMKNGCFTLIANLLEYCSPLSKKKLDMTNLLGVIHDEFHVQ
jgi:hypothetical protein